MIPITCTPVAESVVHCENHFRDIQIPFTMYLQAMKTLWYALVNTWRFLSAREDKNDLKLLLGGGHY